MRQHASTDWNVYQAFFDAQTTGVAYVKIGICTHVCQRMAALITNCPFVLKSVMVHQVGRKGLALRIEKGLHENLAAFRTRGEWFRIDFADKSEVDALSAAASTSFGRAGAAGPFWRLVQPESVREYSASRRRR